MSERPQNLYVVRWRDRLNKPHVALVAANTHAYALGTVERAAPGEIVQNPRLEELYIPEGSLYEGAYVIWEGGQRPGEES